MKKRKHFLFGLACFAIVAAIVGIISYATEIPPTQAPEMPPTHATEPQRRVDTRVRTSTDTAKKKTCGCCSERTARLQEKIRAARARLSSEQPAVPKALVSPQTP